MTPNWIYILVGLAVFVGFMIYGVATARYHDTAGEIVGLAFIVGVTWPLIAVALVVAGVLYAAIGPFWLLTRAALHFKQRA